MPRRWPALSLGGRAPSPHGQIGQLALKRRVIGRRPVEFTRMPMACIYGGGDGTGRKAVADGCDEMIPAAPIASGMPSNDCANSSFGRREVTVTTEAALMVDAVPCTCIRARLRSRQIR